MQDHIPDALIAAFERQYDASWNDPQLRNERLAMRYGWAAAMEAKQCLHQIQEPAPVQAAVDAPVAMQESIIAGALFDFCGYLTTLSKESAITASEAHEAAPMVDALKTWADKRDLHIDDADVHGWRAALSAQAAPIVVPDDMPSTEANTKYGESYGVDWVYEGKKAAPVAVGKREAFEAWCSKRNPNVADLFARNGTIYLREAVRAAWEGFQAGRAALAATPAAALVDKSTELQGSQVDKSVILQDSAPVPVVLPEPFALYDGEKWYANEEAAICSCADMEKLQKVFIESQLLTLLAGVSAPAAQPERKYICPVRTIADLVNNLMLMDQAMPIYGAQYIERPAGQRRAIAVPPTVSIERVKDSRWIGEGETLNTAIIWTRAEQPAAPQAQADARDALTLAELMEVRHALHEIAACGEAKAAYSLLLRAANLNYLDCAQFVGFEAGTFALDAAIAAAKGE